MASEEPLLEMNLKTLGDFRTFFAGLPDNAELCFRTSDSGNEVGFGFVATYQDNHGVYISNDCKENSMGNFKKLDSPAAVILVGPPS